MMTSGMPDFAKRIVSSASAIEQVKVSVTASDSTGTFSQEMKSVLIYNDGPNDVHFNNDAASTTDKFKIPSRSWLMIDVPLTVVHLICATGESATAYLVGVY